MLRTIVAHQRTGAGQREAPRTTAAAARPQSPRARRRAWRPSCRRRRRAPRSRARAPSAPERPAHVAPPGGRVEPPLRPAQAAPARAGRRPAAPTAAPRVRASSSAGWQPRWIVRHRSPGTQHTASHSARAEHASRWSRPPGRASARRRPLFSCADELAAARPRRPERRRPGRTPAGGRGTRGTRRPAAPWDGRSARTPGPARYGRPARHARAERLLRPRRTGRTAAGAGCRAGPARDPRSRAPCHLVAARPSRCVRKGARGP